LWNEKKAILAGIVLGVVIVGIVVLSGGKRRPVPSPGATPSPAPGEPIEQVRPAFHPDAAAVPPVRLARPEQPGKPQGKSLIKDEASLMAKLRELGTSDLELSLKLAQEGNVRYPDSPDAVERAWFVCKSLTGLGRFEEAQSEARKMVEKYPNTSFASDVQRHVLSNPAIPPSAP
jgi:hypothetical protein